MTEKERQRIKRKCEKAVARAAKRIEDQFKIRIAHAEAIPADRVWRDKTQQWESVTIEFEDSPDSTAESRGAIFKIIKEEFLKEDIPHRYILPEVKFSRYRRGAGWGSMGATMNMRNIDRQASNYPLRNKWDEKHYEGFFGVGMQIRLP